MSVSAHASTTNSAAQPDVTGSGGMSRSTDALSNMPSRDGRSPSPSLSHVWPSFTSASTTATTAPSWATRVKDLRKAFRGQGVNTTDGDHRPPFSTYPRLDSSDSAAQYVYQSRARDHLLQQQRSRVSGDAYSRDASLQASSHSRLTLGTPAAANHTPTSGSGSGLSRFFSLRKRTQSSSSNHNHNVSPEAVSSATYREQQSASPPLRATSPLSAVPGRRSRPSSRRSHSVASPLMQAKTTDSLAKTSTAAHAGVEGSRLASEVAPSSMQPPATPASTFSFPARPGSVEIHDSSRSPTRRSFQRSGQAAFHTSSRSVPLSMAEFLTTTQPEAMTRDVSGPKRSQSITKRINALIGNGRTSVDEGSIRKSRQRKLSLSRQTTSAVSPRSHHMSITSTAAHTGTASTRRSHARTMTSPGTFQHVDLSTAVRPESASLWDSQGGSRAAADVASGSRKTVFDSHWERSAATTRKLSLSRFGLGRWRDSHSKTVAARPGTPEIESWKRPSGATKRGIGTPEPDMAEWSPEELDAEVFGYGRSLQGLMLDGTEETGLGTPSTVDHFGLNEESLPSPRLFGAPFATSHLHSRPQSLEHRLGTPSLLGGSPLMPIDDIRPQSPEHRIATPSLLGGSPLLTADDILKASRLSLTPSHPDGLGLHNEVQTPNEPTAEASDYVAANHLVTGSLFDGGVDVSRDASPSPSTPKRRNHVEGLGLVTFGNSSGPSPWAGENAMHSRSQSSNSALSLFRQQSTYSSTSQNSVGSLNPKRTLSNSSSNRGQPTVPDSLTTQAMDDTPILRVRQMVVNTNDESGDESSARNLFFRPVGATSQANMESSARRFHWRKQSQSGSLAGAPHHDSNGDVRGLNLHDEQYAWTSENSVQDENDRADRTVTLISPKMMNDGISDRVGPSGHEHSRSHSSSTPMEAANADLSVLDPHPDMLLQEEQALGPLNESVNSVTSPESVGIPSNSPIDSLGPLPADEDQTSSCLPQVSRRSSGSAFTPGHRRNATATSITTTGSSVPASVNRGSVQMSDAHTVGTSYSGGEALSALDAEVGRASRTQLEVIRLAQGRAEEWARKEASERAVKHTSPSTSPRWTPTEAESIEVSDEAGVPLHEVEPTIISPSLMQSTSTSLLTARIPVKHNVRRARSQPMSAFRSVQQRVPLAPSQRRAASRTSDVDNSSVSDVGFSANAFMPSSSHSANSPVSRGPALRPSHSGSLRLRAIQDSPRDLQDTGGLDGRRAPTPRTSRSRPTHHRQQHDPDSELDGASTSASQWPTSPSDSSLGGAMLDSVDTVLAQNRSPAGQRGSAGGAGPSTPRSKSDHRGTPRSARHVSGGSSSRVPTYATSEEASLAKRREQAEREKRAREKEAEIARKREERYALRKKSDPLLARRLALMGLCGPDGSDTAAISGSPRPPGPSMSSSSNNQADQSRAGETSQRVGRRCDKSFGALLDFPLPVPLENAALQPTSTTPHRQMLVPVRASASDRSASPTESLDAPTVAPSKLLLVEQAPTPPHISLNGLDQDNLNGLQPDPSSYIDGAALRRQRESSDGRSIASSLYTSGGGSFVSIKTFHTATAGDDSAVEDSRGSDGGAWNAPELLTIPAATNGINLGSRERAGSMDTLHSAVSALRNFPTPPGRSREMSSSDGTVLALAQLDVSPQLPRTTRMSQSGPTLSTGQEARRQLRAIVAEQQAGSETSLLNGKRRDVDAARSVSGMGLLGTEGGVDGIGRLLVESRRASIRLFEDRNGEEIEESVQQA